MNKATKELVRTLIARKQFQGIYEFLYWFSLRGMNYGSANSPRDSGEKCVLEYLSKKGVEHPVIFDVGANTGQWAELAFEILGPSIEYYGFEPSKYAFDKLCYNVKSKYPAANTFNAGLSDASGKKHIYFDREGDVQATVHGLDGDSLSAHKELADFLTIDSFVEEKGIDRIDLLKIDAEGHELSILKGASSTLTKERVKMIQFEFGEKHIQSRTFFRDILDVLFKYSVYRIVQNGLVRITYTPEKEIFIGTNYLSILTS